MSREKHQALFTDLYELTMAACYYISTGLDDKHKPIKGEGEFFSVEISPRLEHLQENMIAQVKKEELKER